MQEWKKQEYIAGVENTGVEKAGAITYGKPSEQKTLKTPGPKFTNIVIRFILRYVTALRIVFRQLEGDHKILS